MGLAHRVIPTVLVRGRTLIKGVAFDSWRSCGLAAQAAKIHSMRGVDELILLDISATAEGRGPDLSLIEELSETCFMPLAVGGGIASVNDAKAVLRAGADKVVVCSAGPRAVYEIAQHAGSQAVVGAIDYRMSGALRGRGATHNGSEPRGPLPFELGRMVAAGAGELMLTAIEREGTFKGYDVDTLRLVCEHVPVPVIAHGGCGEYRHMLEAIQAGVNAVAAGAMFQFTDYTPRGAVEYLHMNGVEVRL